VGDDEDEETGYEATKAFADEEVLLSLAIQ
jgi:hypothetical protein